MHVNKKWCYRRYCLNINVTRNMHMLLTNLIQVQAKSITKILGQFIDLGCTWLKVGLKNLCVDDCIWFHRICKNFQKLMFCFGDTNFEKILSYTFLSTRPAKKFLSYTFLSTRPAKIFFHMVLCHRDL